MTVQILVHRTRKNEINRHTRSVKLAKKQFEEATADDAKANRLVSDYENWFSHYFTYTPEQIPEVRIVGGNVTVDNFPDFKHPTKEVDTDTGAVKSTDDGTDPFPPAPPPSSRGDNEEDTTKSGEETVSQSTLSPPSSRPRPPSREDSPPVRADDNNQFMPPGVIRSDPCPPADGGETEAQGAGEEREEVPQEEPPMEQGENMEVEQGEEEGNQQEEEDGNQQEEEGGNQPEENEMDDEQYQAANQSPPPEMPRFPQGEDDGEPPRTATPPQSPRETVSRRELERLHAAQANAERMDAEIQRIMEQSRLDVRSQQSRIDELIARNVDAARENARVTEERIRREVERLETEYRGRLRREVTDLTNNNIFVEVAPDGTIEWPPREGTPARRAVDAAERLHTQRVQAIVQEGETLFRQELQRRSDLLYESYMSRLERDRRDNAEALGRVNEGWRLRFEEQTQYIELLQIDSRETQELYMNMRSEFERVVAENGGMTGRIAQLMEELNVSQSAQSALRESLQEAMDRVFIFASRHSEVEGELARMMAANSTLRQARQDLTASLLSETDRVNSLWRMHQTATDRIANLDRENRGLADLSREREELRSELDRQIAENNEMQRRIRDDVEAITEVARSAERREERRRRGFMTGMRRDTPDFYRTLTGEDGQIASRSNRRQRLG